MEAQRPEHEGRDGPAGGGGGGGLAGVLQLLQLRDRWLQAAGFFLAWGCCMVIYGTAMNPSANLAHVFVGYALFTVGVEGLLRDFS